MKAEQQSNHYLSKSTSLFIFIVWLGDAASRLVMLLLVLPPPVGESPEDRTPTLCCEEHLLILDNYPQLEIIVIRMIFTYFGENVRCKSQDLCVQKYNNNTLSLATPLFIAANEQKH